MTRILKRLLGAMLGAGTLMLLGATVLGVIYGIMCAIIMIATSASPILAGLVSMFVVFTIFAYIAAGD